MIAAPPGWGRSKASWLRGVAAFLLGLALGALGIAAGWQLLSAATGRPPRWALAVLAALLALVAGKVLALHLPGSPLRVPRSWARLGHTGYSAVFGMALGTGVTTALPSPGLYALIAWGLFAPSWSAVWPVFLAFSLGRAVPFLLLAIHAARTNQFADHALDRARVSAALLAPAEATVLAALATVWLLGSTGA